MGVILGPFWNNFEAICQVELSSRSFHALSCPVASSTVYRARPLVCRVIKPVVSCAALADCFDYRIQIQTFGMSSYQIGRFMHCVGRLLRLAYTDPDLWHVELSNQSFHARCWSIASIHVYRPLSTPRCCNFHAVLQSLEGKASNFL